MVRKRAQTSSYICNALYILYSYPSCCSNTFFPPSWPHLLPSSRPSSRRKYRKAIFLWTHKNNTEGMLMLIIWALNWTSLCFNRRWSDSIWPPKLFQGQNLWRLDPATSVTFQVQQSCPLCTGVQIYKHTYFYIIWQPRDKVKVRQVGHNNTQSVFKQVEFSASMLENTTVAYGCWWSDASFFILKQTFTHFKQFE